VPIARPVTMPVAEPIGATAGSLLLHVPPLTAELKVDAELIQILVVPVMADGIGRTETVVVVIPHGNE
jgi:hypothetical protein